MNQPVNAPGTRQVTGSLFRGYVDVLKKQGRLAEVRTRLSPGVVALIDKPPFPLRWIDANAIDEIAAVLYGLHGPEVVRAFHCQVVRDSLGPLLRPLISTLTAMFGASPDTLLSRFDAFAPSVIKGSKFQWTTTGPTSGQLTLSHDSRLSLGSWAGWEGTVLFTLDITGTEGTVSPTRISADGCIGVIDIDWSVP